MQNGVDDRGYRKATHRELHEEIEPNDDKGQSAASDDDREDVERRDDQGEPEAKTQLTQLLWSEVRRLETHSANRALLKGAQVIADE